ncbi:hypothetical protein JCM10207_001637 [Rhodosporidiobolus poonsookiae]
MAWLPRIVIWVSLATLMHAAYAAWQARMLANELGTAPVLTWGSPVPPEVHFQALSSFVILVIGILWSAPELKGVTWASEMSKRSIDSEDSGIALLNVRHRGSVLFKETDDE